MHNDTSNLKGRLEARMKSLKSERADDEEIIKQDLRFQEECLQLAQHEASALEQQINAEKEELNVLEKQISENSPGKTELIQKKVNLIASINSLEKDQKEKLDQINRIEKKIKQLKNDMNNVPAAFKYVAQALDKAYEALLLENENIPHPNEAKDKDRKKYAFILDPDGNKQDCRTNEYYIKRGEFLISLHHYRKFDKDDKGFIRHYKNGGECMKSRNISVTGKQENDDKTLVWRKVKK